MWNDPQNQEKKSCSETLWKYLPSSQPDITEAESTLKTLKVRIYPNKEQKQIFTQCFGASRYFYNKAVVEINSRYESKRAQFAESPTCLHCLEPPLDGKWLCKTHEKKPVPWKLNVSLPSVRAKVMYADKNLTEDDLWQKDVPYDTRQMGINDAVKAYKTSTQLLAKGYISHFHLKPRKKKERHQIFWVNNTSVSKEWDIFPKRIKSKNKRRLRMRKRQLQKVMSVLPEGPNNYAKIQKSGDIYYLIVTFTGEKDKKIKKEMRVLSLDPGVRTFQSGFSTDGYCYAFGERQQILITKLHTKMDELKAKRDQRDSKTKKKLKKRIWQMEKKVTDTVLDLHNQVASFVSKHFSTVVIGNIETGRMLKKGDLPSCVNRKMQCLSHYKFRMKLQLACETNRCQFTCQDESYTTKTCGRCGKMNHEVGSSDTFVCASCDLCADRDFHAARNILLKCLVTEDVSRQ